MLDTHFVPVYFAVNMYTVNFVGPWVSQQMFELLPEADRYNVEGTVQIVILDTTGTQISIIILHIFNFFNKNYMPSNMP